jgi:predicted transcriptional regulator
MLKKLIEIMKEKRVATIKEIAVELDSTEEIVSAMFDELERRGIISSYENCPSSCNDCPIGQVCKKSGKKVFYNGNPSFASPYKGRKLFLTF